MKKLSPKDLELESGMMVLRILGCDNYLLALPSPIFAPLVAFKSREKNLLKKISEIQLKVLEPMFGKRGGEKKIMDEFVSSKVKVLKTSQKLVEVKPWRKNSLKYLSSVLSFRYYPDQCLCVGKTFLLKI